MNLLLLKPEDLLSENSAQLSGRRFDHLKNVLNISVGSVVKTGLTNSLCGEGVIVSLDQEKCVIEFDLTLPPPPKKNIVLVMSMIRPKAFRRSLFYAVSMGVSEIHVIRSWRVDKSYFDSPLLSESSIYETSLLALEQSKDTVLPTVNIHHLFKPFAEDSLPALLSDRTGILCHPYADEFSAKTDDGGTLLAIGPEGGFIQYEVDLLTSYGMNCFRFGDRVLTSENFVASILGRLSL